MVEGSTRRRLLREISEQNASGLPFGPWVDELDGGQADLPEDAYPAIDGPSLRAHLTNPASGEVLTSHGLDLRRMRITGSLDLSGIGLLVPIRFEHCIFDEAVVLENTHVVGADFPGCRFKKGVRAKGMVAEDALTFKGARSLGRVDLSRGLYKGGIDLTAMHIDPHHPAERVAPGLAVTGAEIWTDLVLDRANIACGFYALGTALSGDLLVRGASIRNLDEGCVAVFLDGATIAGKADFSPLPETPEGEDTAIGLTVIRGSLRAGTASIGGVLDLSGVDLDGAPVSVLLDKSTVGSLNLIGGFSATGRITARRSRVDGSVHVVGSRLGGGLGRSLDLEEAKIADDVILAGGNGRDGSFRAARFQGPISVAGVEIGGRLAVRGVSVEGSEPRSIEGLCALISGPVFIDRESRFSGAIDFDGADIGGQVHVGRATLKSARAVDKARVRNDLLTYRAGDLFDRWVKTPAGKASFERWAGAKTGTSAFHRWVASEDAAPEFKGWTGKKSNASLAAWIKSGEASRAWTASGAADDHFRVHVANDLRRDGFGGWLEDRARSSDVSSLDERWLKPLAALSLTNAKVGGLTVYASANLEGAIDAQGLQSRDRVLVHMDAMDGKRRGLCLARARIDGTLALRADKPVGACSLDLSGAHVSELDDRQECWPNPGNLALKGFSLEKLSAGAPKRFHDRRRWVDRQRGNGEASFAATDVALPLIGAWQRSGRAGDASRMAHLKRVYDLRNGPVFQRLVSAPANWLFGFGYRPARLIAWAALLLAAAFFVAETGHRAGLAPEGPMERVAGIAQGALPFLAGEPAGERASTSFYSGGAGEARLTLGELPVFECLAPTRAGPAPACHVSRATGADLAWPASVTTAFEAPIAISTGSLSMAHKALSAGGWLMVFLALVAWSRRTRV